MSAVTATSVTISGPPATLKTLFGSDSFVTKPIAVSVHGPYHAPHLFSNINIEKVLRLGSSSVNRVLSNCVPRYPVLSCSTGNWYTESTSISLVQAIVRDILVKQLDFEKVFQACVDKAREYKGSRCLVIPFGKWLRVE